MVWWDVNVVVWCKYSNGGMVRWHNGGMVMWWHGGSGKWKQIADNFLNVCN